MRTVGSGKTPYVRFDRNSYSIPHTHVRRPLTLLASATTVRLTAGTEEIARHAAPTTPGRRLSRRRMSRASSPPRARRIRRARDRLRLAVPAIATLLDRLAARGESLRVHTARLLALGQGALVCRRFRKIRAPNG
jgi:hypothetical protein